MSTTTPTKSKPKKKKKKSRFHRGLHISPKCTEPIHYRSGWELTVAQTLDLDDEVESYFYEAIKIPYLPHLKSKKPRTYIPDFFIVYRNGTAKLVEVKQKRMLNNRLVMKKAEAGKLWAGNQKTFATTYEFWTDDLIKALTLLLAQKKKKQLQELKHQQ